MVSPHHKPLNIGGLDLVIEWYPGEIRNGYRVADPYGHIPYLRAEDGEATDFWLGRTPRKVFSVEQLADDGSGSVEQTKYIFCGSEQEARKLFLRNRPARLLGQIKEVELASLINQQKLAKRGEQ